MLTKILGNKPENVRPLGRKCGGGILQRKAQNDGNEWDDVFHCFDIFSTVRECFHNQAYKSLFQKLSPML